MKDMEANIVIVDDTPDNLRVFMNILTDKGYRIRPVSKATRALSMIQVERPDLILLDIKMPEMSGYEVCKQLKADVQTCDIPIIFVSALHQLSEKVKAFAAGGVDYITKPFQAEEVLARVETHLTLARLRHHLEEVVESRTTALKNSEQQYRLLIEQVKDGIGILQKNSLVFANETLQKLLGIPKNQLLGKTPAELFKQTDLSSIKPTEDSADPAQASQWHRFEFMASPHEKELWFEGLHSSINWEGESAVLITIHDITDHKLKELELHREQEQLRNENIKLRSVMKDRFRFGKIIGKSPAMQNVYEFIEKAAESDVNVVIYGESGTGKDLIAQSIHEMSPRHKKQFVPVNCGSIQETLFEREFFGNRKGAFTGALSDQPGFFDAAHQGTLFLDEVGELSLAMQVKLLRAIELKSYTPIGDQKAKQADVRIVAATNRNLQTHVKQGLMRQDFFYRINVIPISVPALRERREDIPLLIEHFLGLYSSQTAQDNLPGNILEALYAYDWPGNIRQLQNVLLRYLTLHRLDFDETGKEDEHLKINLTGKQGLWEIVQNLEKRLIIETLEQNHGHKTKTANMLQIPIQTLRRKIIQYQIE